MKKNDKRKHRKSKKKLKKRLEHHPGGQDKPMFTTKTIHYEISDKIEAIHCGGIGAIHMLAVKSGLTQAIDKNLHVLKIHQPYHESDHIMNISHNITAGGQCLEDIEDRREDPEYMDAFEAERVPDPTTEGDFLRRLDKDDIVCLMDTVNAIRVPLWEQQSKGFKRRGILNVDAVIEETTGECKEGMGMSYNGKWSYAPIIISLANTREPLYMENRPGNTPSCVNAATWIDKSINLIEDVFEEVWMRGDTDYSLTENFDRWDEDGRYFVFGYDAMANVCKIADGLNDWKPLIRPPKYKVKTKHRSRPRRVKEAIVEERGYKNIKLVQEEISEFEYQPTKCAKKYRMIVLKKKLIVKEGQLELFDDYRYFFYITNDRRMSASEVVYFANERCDHENDIEQFRNGIKALKMPTGDLLSNWAYMVIVSIAWSLKAWMGLLMPHRPTGKKIIRMEFKRFLNKFVNVPAQIIHRGGQLWYRLIGYMHDAPAFFGFVERCQRLKLPSG